MVLACFTTSNPSKCSTPCQQASQIVSYIYGPHPPHKAGHDKIENREGVVKCKLGPARSLVSFFTAAPPPSQKISHSEDVLEVQLTFLGPPALKCNFPPVEILPPLNITRKIQMDSQMDKTIILSSLRKAMFKIIPPPKKKHRLVVTWSLKVRRWAMGLCRGICVYILYIYYIHYKTYWQITILPKPECFGHLLGFPDPKPPLNLGWPRLTL